MDEMKIFRDASKRFGNVEFIVHRATLLHECWSLDNDGWIVQMDDGRQVALTTSDNGLCAWSREDAERKLKETEASVASIRKALELWPTE